MLLSARALSDYQNVNSFEITQQIEIGQGDNQTIFLQLVDKSVDTPNNGYSPPYRRYIPATGSTLQVTIKNMNSANVVTRYATNPDPKDSSIFSLTLLTTDVVTGTCNVLLTLVEPSRTLMGVCNAFLLAYPNNDSC